MTYEGHVQYPIGSNLSSWYNQGSSVWTQIGNKYNLWCPVGGTADIISGRYTTAPSTPYTVIARIVTNPTDTEGLRLTHGLGFGNGTATMFINTRYDANSQTSSWSVLWCANSTTASANLVGYQYGPGFPWVSIGWMAIRHDGTNIIFYVGDESGQNFYQIYSEVASAHFSGGTITQVGVYIDHGTNTGGVDVMVESFRIIGV